MDRAENIKPVHYFFFNYLNLEGMGGGGWGHLDFNSIIVKNGISTFKYSAMPLA